MIKKFSQYSRTQRAGAIGGVAVLLVGTLSAFAFRSDGYAKATVDLTTSSVWTTKTTDPLVGRVNNQIKALDSSLRMAVANFDIVQSEDQVLVVDRAKNLVQNIDITTVTAGAKLVIPKGAAVGLGHGTVSIADPATGKWWVGTAASLAGLDPATTPALLTTGSSPAVAVSTTGKAFAVAPGSSKLWSVSIGDDGTPVGWTADKAGKPVAPAPAVLPGTALSAVPLGGTSPIAITSVGDTPVVLDSAAKVLIVGSNRMPVVDGATLQQPGPAAGSVIVSTATQLLAYPLSGGAPVTLYNRGAGVAVAPVVVDGCAYAAWNSTTVTETVSCDGAPAQPAVTLPLPGKSKADPVFRVNRSVMVLNDRISGTIWAVDKDLHFVTISNWDEVKPQNQSTNDKNNDGNSNQSDEVTQSRANCAKQGPSKSTVAPAKYTVRAGRSTLLPVLNFVTAGDCAALRLDEVKGMPASAGSAAVVLNGQQVQITTTANASGVLPMTYTVGDGVNSPITSQLSVTVISGGAPGAIKAIRASTTEVEINGSVSYNVLTDYSSATGDDLRLSDAQSLTADDTVDFTPGGQITFSDKGLSGTGKHYVQFTVTDGTNVTSGKLAINVLAENTGKLTAGAAMASSMVGVPVRAQPLQSVLWPGSAPLQLTGVTPKAGGSKATATVNKDGSVVLTSGTPGSYYFTYAVSANDQKASGVLRFDVTAPDPDSAPVATADVVYLPAGDSVRLDPTANDIDPNGLGLAIAQLGTQSSAQLSITDDDMRTLQIASRGTLLEPTQFSYVVSNGSKVATGQIRVIPVEALTDPPLPVANPITLAVRAGDAISLPINQFASDPRGEALSPTIVGDPSTIPGVLFSTKTEIRYLAPTAVPSGPVKFSYSVTNTSSQSSSAAAVTLNVTNPDPDNDAAPSTPVTVVARVLAGKVVTIPLPLDGIDPDGDWVTLTSVSAPEKRLGTAVAAGLSSIAYTSSPALHGIDSLSYTASDPYGKSVTGTVRVIVVPAPREVTPPVAPNLTASVRPGKAIAVRPFDSGVSGENVKFDATAFDPSVGWQIARDGDALVISAPGKTSGTGNITYHVIDDRGQTASGVISVTVSATAPLLPPIAQDIFVVKSMVTDGANAMVNVTNSVKNNNGAAADLTIGLVPGSNGTMANTRTIKIPLTASRQVLAYTATDADQQVAKAFVVVPPKSDLVPDPKKQQQPQQQQPQKPVPDVPPTPRTDVAPIVVHAGASVTRQIADFVTVDAGKSAQIPSGQSLQAGQGTGKRDDASSFTYTASSSGSGADTLSVPVSVGTSPVTDVGVPIQIIPNAPQLSNGQLAVEVGTTGTLNLSTLVDPNYPDKDKLSYSVTGGGAGFQSSASGSTLTVAVATTVAKGTQSTLTVKVSDSSQQSATAQVAVTATGTTKPLPTVTDQTNKDGRPGVATSFSVLDGSTDPFGQGLTVASATLVQGKASVAKTGSSVSVTPSAGQVGTITVQFSVLDGTKDPTRKVTGKLTLIVKDKPHAPGVPTAVAGSETATSVTLNWDWQPTYANGGTMQPFVVKSAAGSTTCPSTSCQIKNLTPGQSYQFTVTATNEIGSTSSARSASITPNAKPPAPQVPTVTLTGDKELTVKWSIGRDDKSYSPVTKATLTEVIDGADGASTSINTSGSGSQKFSGLDIDSAYSFYITISNALGPVTSDQSSPQHPNTTPGPPTNVSLTFDFDAHSLTAGWDAPAASAQRPGPYQYVVSYTKDGNSQTLTTSDTSADISPVSDGSNYKIISVVAQNRVVSGSAWKSGDSSGGSDVVTPFSPPSAVTGVSGATPRPDLTADVSWTAATGKGRSIDHYEYAVNGGSFDGNDAGSGTSATIKDLGRGDSDTISIRACYADESGYGATELCGTPGAASPVIPYVPVDPSVPSIGGQSSSQVVVNWSLPADNGRGPMNAQVAIGPSGNVPGFSTDNSGSRTVQVSCGDSDVTWYVLTKTMDTKAMPGDNGGAGHVGDSQQTTFVVGACPKPTFSISKGSQYTGTVDDGHGKQVPCVNCYHLLVQYANINAGGYSVAVYNNGSKFWTESHTLSTSGSFETAAFTGYSGTVRVVLSGAGNYDSGNQSW